MFVSYNLCKFFMRRKRENCGIDTAVNEGRVCGINTAICPARNVQFCAGFLCRGALGRW